jgi:hypothetical protein
MVSTRPLPRSERPSGRSVDTAARIRARIAAPAHEHPRRSTACLTTLHEPCLGQGARGRLVPGRGRASGRHPAGPRYWQRRVHYVGPAAISRDHCRASSSTPKWPPSRAVRWTGPYTFPSADALGLKVSQGGRVVIARACWSPVSTATTTGRCSLRRSPVANTTAAGRPSSAI